MRGLAACSIAALTASLGVASAADFTTLPSKAPPASDGSSGSFNAQFGTGEGLVWFNVDTGVVWDAASGGFVAFTLPYTVVTWNKQTFHAYNFTDMTVQPSVNLTIYGSAPAMFLAKTGISFAGHFTVAAAGGAGGAAPSQDTPPYNGGKGGSAGGKAGGDGGSGPIGGVQGQCTGEVITAGGGGGGGNANVGAKGLHGNYPIDAAGPPVYHPGGRGGWAENAAILAGGGGGGAGGGGFWAGDFYGQPGANGGGAVVFATRKGTIDIAASGIVDVSGGAGAVSNGGSGSSGGGAGGDIWFYTGKTFSNAGTLNAPGGLGGTSTYTSGCFTQKTVKGPNGGNGSGGNVGVQAATIDNTGTIDVAQGGGSTVNGGTVEMIGRVTSRGRIVGLSNEVTP